MACSLEVDLSKELTAPAKSELELPVEPAIHVWWLSLEFLNGIACASTIFLLQCGIKWNQTGGSKLPRWKLVPTRREQEKWDKASKAATGGSVSHFFCHYL